jgi:glutathione S-transferase
LRGPYYRWLFFAAACLEGAVVNRMLNVTVPPEQAGAVGYGSYEKVVEVLTAAVSRSSFILGKEFSAADVYVGSLISFGLRFGWFDKIPEFKAYFDRIRHRPAALRATALDDALIPPA